MKIPIVLVLILLVAFSAWTPIARVDAQASGPVLGVPFDPPTTYFQTPSNWGTMNTITQIPYLYMFTYGIGGVPLPGIANVPVAVPGSNATKYIVNLRSPNMKWSDGVPITSTDLAYSYGVFLSTGPYANLSSFDVWGTLRDRVSSVTIINSTAVELDMSSPYPLFSMLTWLYQLYPYHYYKQFTGDNVLQTVSTIGGPGSTAYIPANYTAGSRTMQLVANPYSLSWNGATPTIPRMTIQFFTGETSLVSALAAGTVDCAKVLASDVPALSSVPSIKVDKVASNYQMQFFINPGEYPYNSRPFRQALMYLIPKDQINTILYNGTSTAGNPALLPPEAFQTYWPSNAPLYPYNTTAAVNSLKAAGLVQNSAGKWTLPNGTALVVDFETANDDPDGVRAAQIIATSMENVGLQVNLRVLDPATINTDKYTPPGNYKVVLKADQYFPSPFKWMRNPVNLPFLWDNATFKQIYASALQDTDPASALAKLKQSLVILADEAVTNSVVIEPAYVAYNTQRYTNWEPALSHAPDYQTFYDPALAENVLTSVQPISAPVSTTASMVSSTQGYNYSLIAGVIVVLIVAVGITAYLFRRRSKPKS